MLKVVKGDLIKLAKNNEFDIIAHGCNAFHTMGGGIAKLIKNAFPEAYEVDRKAFLRGDKAKLGNISYSQIKRDEMSFTIVNCYSQYFYGIRDNKIPLDYTALKNSLKCLEKFHDSIKIGLPLIGFGLAGGKLINILNIFYDVLNKYDATIVVYQYEQNVNKLVEVIERFIQLKKESELL